MSAFGSLTGLTWSAPERWFKKLHGIIRRMAERGVATNDVPGMRSGNA
jgi:hypothetical protein